MEPPARPLPVAVRTRALAVEREPLRRLVARCLEQEGAPPHAGLGVVLAGDRMVHRLNRVWRGRDHTTDVLSFPFESAPPLPEDADEPDARLIGEVVISIPRCLAQAGLRRCPPGVELARLLVHGCLHLLGHDHERPEEKRRMRAAERRLGDWATRQGIGAALIRGRGVGP